MTDIEKARGLFQQAGLAFPTIPEELAAQLREQGKWLFSTRELKMSPYNLQHYVSEFDGTRVEQCGPILNTREIDVARVEDYSVLSHSGHGANSYALQYYLVYGALGMFLHLGWGGVYMHAKETATQVRDCFSLADQIVPAAQTLQRLRASDCLTIVGSDFYGSYWSAPRESRLNRAVEPRKYTLPYGSAKHKRPAEVLADVLHWLKS